MSSSPSLFLDREKNIFVNIFTPIQYLAHFVYVWQSTPTLLRVGICIMCFHIPANKEPFLYQLACVILVQYWYRSTSVCFHVYSRQRVWHKSYWVRTGKKLCDFTVNTCQHTKFVHRIWWIQVQKHMNWASWTREFTYRTCEIMGRCLLLSINIRCLQFVCWECFI